MKALFVMIVVGVGLLLWLLDPPEEEQPAMTGFEAVQNEKPLAERKLDEEARLQAVASYRAVSMSDNAERCKRAGAVAAAFMQEGDDAAYNRWKETERSACAAASKEAGK